MVLSFSLYASLAESGCFSEEIPHRPELFPLAPDHSTVTDFARFLGWSTSVPFASAV